MNTLAIKIISIFGIVFCHGVFADSYEYKPSDITTQPFQHVSSDTNKAGMTRTEMTIYNGGLNFETILMIHDRKGDLKYSRYHIYKNAQLIQTVNDGILRNIISGNTPCDFSFYYNIQ